MCTSRAPASYISCTIFFEVVPRTTLSSTSTMRVAADDAGVGGVLEFDAELADALLGLDEGAADVVIADDAELEGHAALLAEADGRGHARIRDGHDDVGSGRSLARELHAHLLADVVDGAAADDAVGPREVDVFEDAGPRRALRERAVAFEAVGSVMTTTSPFSTSRTNSAPTMSRAQVSEASDIGDAEPADDERTDADGIARAIIMSLVRHTSA